MRFLLPLVSAFCVLVAAVSPHTAAGHVHAGERCTACLVRGAEAAEPVVPDLAPPVAPAVDVVLDPGFAPVTGAPQGATPGQSPPAVA